MQFFALRASPVVLWVVAAAVAAGAVTLDWVVLDGFVWQRRAAGFPTAAATVVTSEVVERRGGKGGTTYTLELAYQFTVAGRTYVGTRVRYFVKPSSKHRAEIDRLRAEYAVARPVVAYYPPDSPADAILRPGVEGTDYLRALFALGLTVLAGGATRLAFGKQPRFDPNDPDQARQTDAGWEARMPGASHAAVFCVAFAAATLLGGFVVTVAHGENPAPEVVGVALAGAVGVAAVAAALLSHHPTLAADLDARTLTLPAPWFGWPVRVPFEQVGTVAVREEEHAVGRGGDTYTVYRCEIGWGTSAGVQITTVAAYLHRADAERLAAWINMAVGRMDTELGAVERPA
ncbi:DUF3592 domain-containing protein [Gemmata sp.]|uniref:DUF3592 domain-containing protein n=1 Tax=Gemmata sp. TaxID=1914242 RepID=UPI003F6EA1EC